jgi:hypothetical protein
MKQLYCILLLSILSTAAVKAQDLYLQFNSGGSVVYGLSTIDRITFSTTDMQVHISGSSMQSYGIDSISYYKYNPITTGLKNVNVVKIKELKLYPNPTSSTIQLEYNLEEAGEVQILLYSLSGQQLMLQKESTFAGDQQLTLDLKAMGIQSGVYFLELRSSKERFINKLILQ